jgi:hypothetical protein
MMPNPNFERFQTSVLDLLSNLAVLELRECGAEGEEHEQERALVFKYLLEEFREYTIDRGKIRRQMDSEWNPPIIPPLWSPQDEVQSNECRV